ncbi:MAG: ATP-binding protein [Spirochaetaceae bacterium]|nr:ATP-binding protein [Spirochaetaceae bacterium]
MQTKTFLATDENMQTINDFVHAALPPDCLEDVLFKIDVAVEEIYINIAHYAYAPSTGEVEVSCGEENGVFTVMFSDRGKPFDPLAHADPDITLSADEREIGGLGIFMTKKFMSSVAYRYEDGKNILTITKALA